MHLELASCDLAVGACIPSTEEAGACIPSTEEAGVPVALLGVNLLIISFNSDISASTSDCGIFFFINILIIEKIISSNTPTDDIIAGTFVIISFLFIRVL
jgi:hypothetical protein